MLYIVDFAKPAEYAETFGLVIRLAASPGLPAPEDIDLDSPPLPPRGTPSASGLVFGSTEERPLAPLSESCYSGCPLADVDAPDEAWVTDLAESAARLYIEPGDLGTRIVFGFSSDAELVPDSAHVTLQCNENCP